MIVIKFIEWLADFQKNEIPYTFRVAIVWNTTIALEEKIIPQTLVLIQPSLILRLKSENEYSKMLRNGY